LIEVMICIAIMAIVMGSLEPVQHGLHGLNRDTDYRYALANAQRQLDMLRQLPYDALPPEVVTVRGGHQMLQHGHLLPGSVSVWSTDGRLLGAPPAVQAESGTIAWLPAWQGQQVRVDYSYHVADVETHTVGPDHAVDLWNTPVLQVVDVRSEHGDQVTDLGLRGTVCQGNRVRVPATGVVQVEYLGGRVENVVVGQFLDDDLRPSPRPTDIKLMTVEEAYGTTNRLKLSELRTRSER
jgi:hypothetical protein